MESLSQISKIIIRTPDVCNSRPRLRGTRLEVYNIVADLYLDSGMLKEYTEDRKIPITVLNEILDYCRNLKCQKIEENTDNFCSGCILSTLHERYNFKDNDFHRFDQGLYENTIKGYIGLGEVDDLEEEEFGRPGWIMASRIDL